MKKMLSLMVLAFLMTMNASAQMIAYQVSTNVVGEPGTPTVIDLQGTTGKDLSGLMIDAEGNLTFNSVENAKCFPIGFDFGYNSQTMKYFLIGTDGEIQLSATETCSTDIHKNFSIMFTTDGCHDAFGVIMRNGTFGYADTEISYWIEGVEGTRALCIQYKNIGLQTASYYSDQLDVAKATIQYRLYEKSGNIEMKVKGFKPYDSADVGSYNFMRIGILGDSNDFVQIQSYDGSVISAKDNTIKYGTENYPQDGTVWTFQAPEACETPASGPSDLVVTTTTTQVNGTFTLGAADHYLVLASTDSEITAPTDKTKYAVEDSIGNARVIAIVTAGEFEYEGLEGNTTYNFAVYGFNSLCMNGPLYNATPATATLATKPGAPAALKVTDADRTSFKFTTESSGATVVVAMTAEQEVNDYEQHLANGVFGTPTGTYAVGDAIEGGGKIVYIGSTTDAAVELSELTASTPYFLRAWSTDGNGGYSSEYLDVNTVTASDLPWQLEINENLVVGDDYLGWTSLKSEDAIWTDYASEGYIYSQISYADETTGTETWYESPYIYLAEGTNRIKTAVAGTSGGGWMAGDWTLGDGDKIIFQITADGAEYKDILTIDKNNAPSLKSGEFTPFQSVFSDYAGQKVRLRIYVKRFTAGQTQFNRIYLEQKPPVDYPSDIKATVDGASATISWTAAENAVSYDVSYKKPSDEEWSEAQNTTETSIELSGLDGLSNYQVRVRSIGATATSGWSDAITFATGAVVPFEFVVADADDLSVWTAYTGELNESSSLTEGGDVRINTGGWGGKYIRFMPYSASQSWLVSPAITLDDDNTKQYQATITITTLDKQDDITLKLVVAQDGESFSSANVIGTISGSDFAATEETKDFIFDFTGFSGNIRIGYYLVAETNNSTWIQFDKMGAKVNTTPTFIREKVMEDNANAAIYNISGQRLQRTQKGLNIVNGKKVAKK